VIDEVMVEMSGSEKYIVRRTSWHANLFHQTKDLRTKGPSHAIHKLQT
jgi:hypothetical protein